MKKSVKSNKKEAQENPLLFLKITYDCPQNTPCNEVLAVCDGCTKYVITFTQKKEIKPGKRYIYLPTFKLVHVTYMAFTTCEISQITHTYIKNKHTHINVYVCVCVSVCVHFILILNIMYLMPEYNH
jgi:hypothetical protein